MSVAELFLLVKSLPLLFLIPCWAQELHGQKADWQKKADSVLTGFRWCKGFHKETDGNTRKLLAARPCVVSWTKIANIKM